MLNPVATSTVSMLEHPMAAPASASELTTYDLLLYDLILVHQEIGIRLLDSKKCTSLKHEEEILCIVLYRKG